MQDHERGILAAAGRFCHQGDAPGGFRLPEKGASRRLCGRGAALLKPFLTAAVKIRGMNSPYAAILKVLAVIFKKAMSHLAHRLSFARSGNYQPLSAYN